ADDPDRRRRQYGGRMRRCSLERVPIGESMPRYRSKATRVRVYVLAAVRLMSISPTDASAATVYVANDGVDAASCGGKATPCRSISRGIANANSGDTLLVGPGRYGDLDGDA